MKAKKRFIGFALIASLMLSLAGSAWAYTASAIQMKDGQTAFKSATINTDYNQTVDYIYADSKNPPTIATAYFCVTDTSTTLTTNDKPGTTHASVSLGNGLTASVTNGNDKKTASVKVSGTPTQLGDVSFMLWKSGKALTDNMTSIKSLKITISVKEAFKSPTAKPTFKTALKLSPDAEIKGTKTYELEVNTNQAGIANIALGSTAPSWATLTEDGDNKATLSVTPTETGTFTIPVTAAWDEEKSGGEIASSAQGTTTANFTLKVTGVKPTITSSLGDEATDLSGAFATSGVDEDGSVVAGTALGTNGLTFTATGTKGNRFTIAVTGLPTGMRSTVGAVKANEEDPTMSELTATITGSPTKAGSYTIKVSGTNDAGKGEEVSYTLNVSSNPDLKSLKLNDVTWGVAYNSTMTARGLQTGETVTWSIEDPEEGATGNWLSASDFGESGTTGLTLDPSTGKISGTWDKMDAVADGEGVALGSARDKTYKVLVKAKLGKAEPTQTVNLKFKAAAPKIGTPTFGDEEVTGTVEFEYGGEGEAKELKVTATGPGKVKLKANNAPKWMTIKEEEDETTKQPTLTITGTPAELATNASFTVEASNAAGKTTSTIRYSVTGELAWDTDTEHGGGIDPTAEGALPDGNYKKGADITDASSVLTVESLPGRNNALPGNMKASEPIKIVARPGPIQWRATGLPAGVTLKPDTKDGTVAYLSGKPTAVTTKLDDDGKSPYTITATNTVTKDVLTCGGSIVVYDTPTITTRTLPALSTGRAYSTKIAGQNVQVGATWEIKLADTEAGASDGSESLTVGSGTVEADVDTLTITGDSDIDRVPDSGYVYAYIKVENPAGSDEKTLPIAVKGVAAKIDNVTFGDLAEENITFTSTGTQPITMTAYIDKAAAKSMFGVTDGSSIDLTVPDNAAKLTFTPNTGNAGSRMKSAGKPVNVKDNEESATDANNGTGTLAPASDITAIYKNVPVTIAVQNAGMARPATKVFKINYTPSDYEKPSLEVDSTAVTANPDPIQGKAGEDVSQYVISVKGTDPLDIKVAGAARDDATEGVKATVNTDAKTVTVNGTYPAGRESKTTITVTATNTSTKDKVSYKFTFVGALAPEITTKTATALTKEVEAGKSVNISIAAKGTKNLTWSVADALPEEHLFTDDEGVEAGTLPEGLTLDPAKGKISGTPTAPTVNEDGAYAPVYVPIKVENAAGDDDTTVVKIGVKGKKATLSTRTVTIQKGDDLENQLTAAALEVSGVAEDDKDKVKFSPAETIKNKVSDNGEAEKEKLTDLGLTLVDNGTWSGETLKATKGTNVKVAVENIGTVTTGNVKIIIKDVAPEIECEDNNGSRIPIDGSATEAVEETYTLSIKDGTVTGDTAVAWKLSSKPAKIQATLTPSRKTESDIAGKTATLTVKVPKGFKNNQVKVKATTTDEDGKVKPVKDENGRALYNYSDEVLYTELTVTLTNNSTRVSDTMTFKFKVSPAKPADANEWNLAPGVDPDAETEDGEAENNNSLPSNVASDKTEAEAEESDERLTVGEARTAENLTAGERAFLEENGYVIAAVLPETKASESDWYNIDVELAEEAPEGGELAWFAFPRDAEATDDDTAVFYGEDGAEIDAVPAGRKTEVSAWFNEGVTYAPVIAVKVDSAAGAKDTLDDADAGDVVTEEALKANEAKE